MNIVLRRELRTTRNSTTEPKRSSATPTASMPDIANAPHTGVTGTLDWVGMGAIQTPVLLESGGEATRVPAECQVYVNLTDAEAKGIHMSRLYLLLESFAEDTPLSAHRLHDLLQELLSSHKALSDAAAVEFKLPYQRRQAALLSENSGWQTYPVVVKTHVVNGEPVTDLTVTVTYSSTCPCSAALARQLIQKAFSERFSGEDSIDAAEVEQWLGTEQGVNATPHSQRSTARVTVRLSQDIDALPLDALIDALESALGTPVQTAVKREDEQEFARLNGQNLMFCEDAARKLKQALNNEPSYADFKLRIDHFESLHAHDAVAMASKGVEGGFTSEL